MNKVSCLFKLNEDEEKALHTQFFHVEPMMCMCRYFGLMLKSDGHVELLGQPNSQKAHWKPFQAEAWTGVVRLYKSEKHMAGLKKDGTVVACGYNDKNQCETGNWQNIKEIYMTDEATAGIDHNGATYHTCTFEPVTSPVSAANTPAAGAADFRYKLNDDNTITLTKYTGQEQDVVIPHTIMGKTVTDIGTYVFYKCNSLTSVTIPDSITSIGQWAFDGCTGLTSVTIPDSVISIGAGAFNGCTGLTSVTLPDSLISIGNGAFNECICLMVINLPNSVKNIGNAAFYGCQGLADQKGFVIVRNVLYSYHGKEREITIPENVTHIEDWVFKNCTGLRSVTMSEIVTHIGEEAFLGCNKLMLYAPHESYAETYAYAQNIPFCQKSYPKKNADEALFGCKESDDGTVSITSYNGHEKNLILPPTIRNKSVKTIEGSVFVGCTDMTSVMIPDSVTSIGSWTFFACTGLTSVTIPNSVKSIDERAFFICSALTSVTIPFGVESIKTWVFGGCISLTSVTLPDSLKSIEHWAFGGCTSLTSFTVPSGVTSIGDWVFYGCTGLKSVMIPDSVTHIGKGAFSLCGQLTIYSGSGSYAEKYAKEHSIHFCIRS